MPSDRTARNKRYYEKHKEEINRKNKETLTNRYHTDEEYRKSFVERQKAYYHYKKNLKKNDTNTSEDLINVNNTSGL